MDAHEPSESVTQTSPLRGFLMLFIALAATFAVTGPVSYYSNDMLGLTAAALAAGACLLGGVAALAASRFSRGPDAALVSLLVGMLFRTGVPLSLALVVFYRGGPLLEAGFARCLLLFYLVTLVVETVLSVAAIRQTPSASGGA